MSTRASDMSTEPVAGEPSRPRLVLATANQHKLAELTRILEKGRVEVETGRAR